MPNTITSPVYVVQDNIDTDQIIPAQYLTLVPTIAEEYEKLGSYALIGLPDDQYPQRFVPEGGTKTPYKIVIAGRNFGCGSSREHAPIAMGAAGTEVVIAESYARIFFRNCVATEDIQPMAPEPHKAPPRLASNRKGERTERTFDGPVKRSNVKSTPGDPLFDVNDVPLPMKEPAARPEAKATPHP
jgi:3-isopropylmalate/(R)-2-methylmalate dehydratase small subunit